MAENALQYEIAGITKPLEFGGPLYNPSQRSINPYSSRRTTSNDDDDQLEIDFDAYQGHTRAITTNDMVLDMKQRQAKQQFVSQYMQALEANDQQKMNNALKNYQNNAINLATERLISENKKKEAEFYKTRGEAFNQEISDYREDIVLDGMNPMNLSQITGREEDQNIPLTYGMLGEAIRTTGVDDKGQLIKMSIPSTPNYKGSFSDFIDNYSLDEEFFTGLPEEVKIDDLESYIQSTVTSKDLNKRITGKFKDGTSVIGNQIVGNMALSSDEYKDAYNEYLRYVPNGEISFENFVGAKFVGRKYGQLGSSSEQKYLSSLTKDMAESQQNNLPPLNNIPLITEALMENGKYSPVPFIVKDDNQHVLKVIDGVVADTPPAYNQSRSALYGLNNYNEGDGPKLANKVSKHSEIYFNNGSPLDITLDGFENAKIISAGKAVMTRPITDKSGNPLSYKYIDRKDDTEKQEVQYGIFEQLEISIPKSDFRDNNIGLFAIDQTSINTDIYTWEKSSFNNGIMPYAIYEKKLDIENLSEETVVAKTDDLDRNWVGRTFLGSNLDEGTKDFYGIREDDGSYIVTVWRRIQDVESAELTNNASSDNQKIVQQQQYMRNLMNLKANQRSQLTEQLKQQSINRQQ